MIYMASWSCFALKNLQGIPCFLFDARRKWFSIHMYLNIACISTDLRVSFLSLEISVLNMANDLDVLMVMLCPYKPAACCLQQMLLFSIGLTKLAELITSEQLRWYFVLRIFFKHSHDCPAIPFYFEKMFHYFDQNLMLNFMKNVINNEK